MSHHYNKALHRFAVFTAGCTFCLVIAGGLVTSTGSGLAVPDWPLSYGMVMPPMVGGILYEHTHRLVASFVGVLTIILAIWLWRKEERRWLRITAVLALCLVIAQGLLGGLTVYLLLPTAISVTHATLAQTFFCLVVAIALFTSRWWSEQRSPAYPTPGSNSILPLSIATCAVIYIQLILGALMRHTHSGLAVPDFPLMYGQLIPSLSPESLAAYNERLISLDILSRVDDPITVSQIVVHVLHRLWAIIVVATVIGLSWKLFRFRRYEKRMSVFASIFLSLIMLQVFLGAISVLSHKAVIVTTAHVATGALLLGTSALLVLYLYRLAGVTALRFSFSAVRKEAVA